MIGRLFLILGLLWPGMAWAQDWPALARPDAADRIMAAVGRALEAGARTRDLGGDLSTTAMTDAIIDCL